MKLLLFGATGGTGAEFRCRSGSSPGSSSNAATATAPKSISRADLAHYLLTHIDDHDTWRQTVEVSA